MAYIATIERNSCDESRELAGPREQHRQKVPQEPLSVYLKSQKRPTDSIRMPSFGLRTRTRTMPTANASDALRLSGQTKKRIARRPPAKQRIPVTSSRFPSASRAPSKSKTTPTTRKRAPAAVNPSPISWGKRAATYFVGQRSTECRPSQSRAVRSAEPISGVINRQRAVVYDTLL